MFECQHERLAAEQRKREAEEAALKAGHSVVEDLKHLTIDVLAKDAAASATAQRDCELQYLYAAARHLWFQRNEVQLWLQRAEYFVNELKSNLCFRSCNVPKIVLYMACYCSVGHTVFNIADWVLVTTIQPAKVESVRNLPRLLHLFHS